jgi:hypothetical protein
MILGDIDLSKAEVKEALLPHHRAGLQYTATGYGGKIPSTKMVKHEGRWRRIYVACYSNGGTAYITRGADWIVCR